MPLRDELKQRLRTSRPFREVLAELEGRVAAIADPLAKAAALRELGEACEGLLLEMRRAREYYRAAFELDPGDVRAIERARAIYLELGDLEMVMALCAVELKVEHDPARQARLHGALGVAALDLGDAKKATAHLEAALASLPPEERTPELLEAYAAAAHDPATWEETLVQLTDEALRFAASEPPLAGRLFLRIARVLHLEAPGDPRYEAALRNCLGFAPDDESANLLLEGLLARAGRWDDLEALQEERADAAPDDRTRVALHRRFAVAWAERFGDEDRAAAWFRRALEGCYTDGVEKFDGHLAAFDFLRRRHGARGDWKLLLHLADLALNSRLSDDDVAILALQAATISWRELGDVEKARRYFESLARVDPASAELHEFARAVGDDAIAAPNPTGAQGAPLTSGAMSETKPEATESNEESTSRTQPVAPVVEEVATAAAGGVAATVDAPTNGERHDEKTAETIPFTPPPEAPASAEESLPEAARAAMESARAAESAGPDKAIDAWKKVVAAHPTLKAPRAELVRVLRGAERWNALVEALKEQAEKLPQYTPEEKVEALFQLADVYRDRLRLDVMVMNSLNAVLALQPQNARALDALVAQYEHMKRWPDLIGALQKKAALAGDRLEQIELYTRVATLFQEKFSNAAEAIKAYEKVLELDPANAGAIVFLKTNYEKRRDWEKLIGVHQREIERIDDGAERTAKYIEVAKLASEKLKKPSVSIELWAKVLEGQPDHVEALAELEKLYEREKQWDKLAEVLERQAQAAPDAAKKVAILQKLGILFTDRVADAERAIEAWKALLAVEPENKRGQDALKKLYTSAKRWSDLEAFYAAQGKYDEYIRVLERQVEAEDEATKIVLNTRVAELYRDQLGKPDRAMRAYEKVLTLDGKNLAAAEALLPLYEGAKDGKKLAGVLEIQLEHTPREDERLRLERMRRLVELSEGQLRDKAAAYGWALRAFSEVVGSTAPVDGEWARQDAERLAAETGAWAELVATYEDAYGKLSAEAALGLMLVVAQVYEQHLVDAEKALATNQRILTVDENNAEALAALERLYLATHQFGELLKVYEKKLALESDPLSQKEIRYRIAALFEEELEDAGRAIDAYVTILVQNGDELPALRALDRIYAATGRYRELADVIPRELALADEGDAAAFVDLKLRLGATREAHLGDVGGAIECYRDIVTLDGASELPQFAEARAALERLLHDDAQEPHRLEVAAILEPIYQGLGEWAKLVEVHEIQLAREQDAPTRVGLLLRIGELQADKLGDPDKAFDAYARCFRIDPSEPTARAELEGIAEPLEAWEQLVALYQSAVEGDGAGALDPHLQREILIKIAEALDEKLGQSERAVDYYKRAQSIEPDDSGALEALEKLYTRQEKWPELLDTYRRKVELTDDREAREAIYFRMAYLQEEMLQNVDDAVATYKEVLAQDENNLKALKALDRLYQSKEAWHELADNLSRQLELVPAGDGGDAVETVGLLLRLAQLREQKLGEVAAAVDTYRQVLERKPDEAEATEALERLRALPEHELQVATILEPIYRARDDWKKLVEVYEIQVRHALDPARKIELLHAIGDLYEVGGDGDAAFATYDRALREDPGLGETQQRLERLARVFDRWQDLVKLYKSVLAESPTLDPELQVALWTRVAQVYEEQLHDDAEAAAAYHRVLAVDGNNLAAADALEAIYVRTEQWQPLVEVVLRKVEMVPDVAAKKELGFKAAKIHEEVLDQPVPAIDVYRLVLRLDENDTQAIEALERLYIRLERWEDLKDVYAKKAELAPTVDEKKHMYFVLGQVYDRELKDKNRAIETYQTLLDLDPTDHQAIEALDRLYGETQRWYDLLQILEREVELAGSTGELVSLKYRVGQLWETQLRDLSRAVEAYREVLATDGSNEVAIAALEGIVHGDQEPVLAAAVLEPIYEAAGEWEKLVDVYEVMGRHADDPVRRVELLHRVGELLERQLGRPIDAFRAFGRALREDPTNEQTLTQLERLAGAVDGWSDLAALYEDEIKKLMDPPRQVEMLLLAARVYEEELSRADAGAVDKAIATYRRVIDVEPDQKAAILSLDRLYAQTGRFADLADVLRHEVRLATSDEQILELEFRLGQLYETELKDVDKAIEMYREILGANPEHAQTLAAMELLFSEGVKQAEVAATLEPLYRVAEQWDKLVNIYTAQLERIVDPADRLAMLQRIAELCEQKLADRDGLGAALHYWSQALREAPLSELAGEEVERLARQLGAWEELVGLYVEIFEAQPEGADPDTGRQVLLKLARVYEEELKDVARAEDAFLRVLAIDAKDPIALAALDRLYEGAGMWAELAEILARRIEITPATDDMIELYARLGRVYAEALGELDAAVQAYDAILELDSRNRGALESLEQIYFRREAWQDLYGVYEKLVDVAQGDAEMAECYAHMAKIASEALAPSMGEAAAREKSIELWGRVIDLRGEDPIALESLGALYERAQQWRELVDVLERRIRITLAPEEQAPLWAALGRIHRERLHEDRDALDAWLRVLELDPASLDALHAVAAIHKDAQAWPDLVDTIHRLIEVGQQAEHGLSDEELKELYAELGALEAETLLRPQEAIDAWQKVLAFDPGDLRALAALERLFTQEARWEECISVLEKKARVVGDQAARIEVLLQVASLWEDKVGDAGRAAEVYERVLAAEPGNMTASIQLEQIYRSVGNYEKLIELLLARVEHLGTAGERISLLHNVAEIYEQHLGDREGAFVVLQAAFKEDYSNDVTARELERIATATNKWNELVAEYTTMVQTITDPHVAADLWVKIGRWYGEHLGHLDYAIASEQQALTLDPDHKEALAQLAEFYRKQSKWPELVDVLARHAAALKDGEEPAKRVELLLALADLQEGALGDTAKAIAAYREAVATDPTCLDALDALERLYKASSSWTDLIDVLAKKAAAEDGERAIAIQEEIGALYEDQLADPPRAIATYRQVLLVDPRNVPALRSLERLYERTGAMESYLEILEQQLDVVATDDERVAIQTRMAQTWEERFHKNDRAAEVLERILTIDDRHEPTLRTLERLYRAERRFADLVDTLRRHVNATRGPAARIELYAQMGAVYEDELRDLDRAVEAYTDILSFDPDHVGALVALGRLYEKLGDWDRAIDAMSRTVQLTDEARLQTELQHRMGRIYEERLSDPDTAEARYVEALAIDPTYVPAIFSLVELHKQRGDWLKAAQMMVRAEQNTSNPVEKEKLLYEAGRIYREKLDDEPRAGELFAQVLQLDPEHVEAGEPLADLYFRESEAGAERWVELEPVLDMLVRKADKNKSNAEMNQLYYRLAKTASVLGNTEKALKFYKLAYELDSTYLPTLLGRADLLFKQEDWEGAFKIYQTILVHHRESQSNNDIVEIFYRLGVIKSKQGERKKALNMFEKALEIEASHRPSLLEVINLQSALGDFEAVVAARRALMPVSDDNERFKLYDEIGDIQREKLKNPQKALAAYQEALALKPENHVVLQKALELYVETKQWPQAVEALKSFAELEKNPVIRGKYHDAAAKILRDEIKSIDDSIEHFNLALDSYFEKPENATPDKVPGYLKAFEAIDRMVTGLKDWKNQERNYRKMIKRLPPDGLETVKVALWHALGEIYRSRLKEFGAAMQAFEVAVKLDPNNVQRREILAELYIVAGPDSAMKAVGEHTFLLKQDPFRIESYRALRKLYMDLRQYDKAWCMCNALVYLQRADAEEKAFFEQYRQKGFVRARQRLTDEMWAKNLMHPDEDRYIGAIFAAIWQAVATAISAEHKQFGLKRKDKLDLATHQALFSKVFAYVAQVLNVALPEIYLRPEQQGGMQLANTKEKGQLIPSLVVGAELLQGRSDKELAFPIAKFLTLMRPEHYLKLTLPTNTELRIAFQAALKLVVPNFPVPQGDAPAVEKYMQSLRANVAPAMQEQLGMVVQRFIGTKAAIDLNKWSQASELTAHRAGFVITNDLPLAAKMVQMEPVVVGGLQPQDKVKELVMYAISEQYFELRQQLGITIG